MNDLPQVVRYGIIDMQVCVPKSYKDKEVKAFADNSNPSGTEHGWFIRKNGDLALAGAQERERCSDRLGFVHIMLDA